MQSSKKGTPPHPLLKKRSAIIEGTKFRMFNNKILTCKSKKLNTLSLSPVFLSKLDKKLTLQVFINDSDFVRKKINQSEVESVALNIKSGDKIVDFTYVEKDTVFNSFGALLNFKYKNVKNYPIEEIRDVTLEIKESDPSGVSPEETYRFLSI